MPPMAADSSLIFERTAIQSLMIWGVAETVVTVIWLILHHRISQRWYQFAQLIRLCAIPYLALLAGEISQRSMGLTGYDWGNSLSVGSILMIVIVAIWFGIRIAEESSSLPLDADVQENGLRTSSNWSKNGLKVLTASGLELNWCFWRVIGTQLTAWLFVELDSPIYWGVTLSVMLLAIFIFFSSSSLATTLTNITILIATSVLFLFTRNFWLCWLLHTILLLSAMPDTRLQQQTQ